MASTPILPDFKHLKQLSGRVLRFFRSRNRPGCTFRASPLNQDPQHFPRFVCASPVAMRYWRLLSLLNWERFPERDFCHNHGQPCVPIMATSIGARIRYQLDRDSELYKEVYKQRTATERINSQAVALGIERPRLRNGQAIANQNTLIYVLINLRALQRVRAQKTKKTRLT